MNVEVTAPLEFQGSVMGGLSKRHAVITNQDSHDGWFTLETEVSRYRILRPLILIKFNGVFVPSLLTFLPLALSPFLALSPSYPPTSAFLPSPPPCPSLPVLTSLSFPLSPPCPSLFLALFSLPLPPSLPSFLLPSLLTYLPTYLPTYLHSFRPSLPTTYLCIPPFSPSLHPFPLPPTLHLLYHGSVT